MQQVKLTTSDLETKAEGIDIEVVLATSYSDVDWNDISAKGGVQIRAGFTGIGCFPRFRIVWDFQIFIFLLICWGSVGGQTAVSNPGLGDGGPPSINGT